MTTKSEIVCPLQPSLVDVPQRKQTCLTLRKLFAKIKILSKLFKKSNYFQNYFGLPLATRLVVGGRHRPETQYICFRHNRRSEDITQI